MIETKIIKSNLSKSKPLKLQQYKKIGILVNN